MNIRNLIKLAHIFEKSLYKEAERASVLLNMERVFNKFEIYPPFMEETSKDTYEGEIDTGFVLKIIDDVFPLYFLNDKEMNSLEDVIKKYQESLKKGNNNNSNNFELYSCVHEYESEFDESGFYDIMGKVIITNKFEPEVGREFPIILNHAQLFVYEDGDPDIHINIKNSIVNFDSDDWKAYGRILLHLQNNKGVPGSAIQRVVEKEWSKQAKQVILDNIFEHPKYIQASKNKNKQNP